MHVISVKKLRDFWETHPNVKQPLIDWYNFLSKHEFTSLIELQKTFSDVEFIGKQRYVFNIKGNNARVICVIQFNHQTAYIRSILTHAEYDKICQGSKKKKSSDKTLLDI